MFMKWVTKIIELYVNNEITFERMADYVSMKHDEYICWYMTLNFSNLI